jgi:regulatory protein
MAQMITALKVQKRNPNRVNVYLDGEFAFGLSRATAAWLRVNQPLSPEKIAALRAQDAQEDAFQQALRFLSFRPRSVAEVRKKLVDKNFDSAVIETVIQRLIESDYLGDQSFAEEWVENRTTFRPRSRRMLQYELRKKGVAEEHIQSALARITDEPELAYQAGIRYAARLADLDRETFRRRLGAFLSRRGFSYGTIAPVVERIWKEIHSQERTS